MKKYKGKISSQSDEHARVIYYGFEISIYHATSKIVDKHGPSVRYRYVGRKHWWVIIWKGERKIREYNVYGNKTKTEVLDQARRYIDRQRKHPTNPTLIYAKRFLK